MMTRFNAFDETFRTLDRIQRHFDDVFGAGAPSFVAAEPYGAAPWPAIALHENDDAFVLRAEVPGLTQDDVSLVVENDTLVVSGERKIDSPDGYRAVVRERVPARFSRKVTLSSRIDAARVEAKLANGILTITLPKASEAKKRQIAVKVG
jgi:HSP20 family protein